MDFGDPKYVFLFPLPLLVWKLLTKNERYSVNISLCIFDIVKRLPVLKPYVYGYRLKAHTLLTPPVQISIRIFHILFRLEDSMYIYAPLVFNGFS